VYEELTKARSELKTIQTRAFEENQQLAQQLANTKYVFIGCPVAQKSLYA